MRWIAWMSLVASAGWIGCGFSSSGDDLINPATSGTGVADAATGGAGGVGGSSGEAGKAGASGATGGSGGVAGSAGEGGGPAGTGGEDAGPGGAGTGGTAGAAGSPAGSGGGPGGAGGSDAGTDASDPENCTNQVDDNGDGLIDCADPLCEPGYVCVPRAPNGWSEPGYVAERGSSPQPSDCESLVPFGKVLHADLQLSPAQCPCACGTPTGGTCEGDGILWQYAACGGGNASSNETCNGIPPSWSIGSVLAYQGTVTATGTCVSSVTTTIPPVQWGASLDLCLPVELGAGCGADQVCIPRPPQDADEHACIASTGDKGCSGAYPEKRLYFEGYDDTRACTDGTCSCNAAEAQQCTGEYLLYSDDTCTDVVFSAPLDGACHDTGLALGGALSDRIVVDSPSGGACSPQGNGTPVGALAPKLPHTVCCTPQPVP